MAYHTRFSFGVSTPTNDEKQFLLSLGSFVAAIVDEPDMCERPDYDLADFGLELDSVEEVKLLALSSPTGVTVEEIRHLDLPAVVIYADDDGDVEAAATIVEVFLRRFAPDKCVTFTWSVSCDSPRINEFGGGACLVCATGSKMTTTDEMAASLLSSSDIGQDAKKNYGG